MSGGAALHPDLPRVSARWVRLALWYAPRYVRKYFSAVRLLGGPPEVAESLPMVIVLNHPSWWDPMAGAVLIDRFFRSRVHYGPIDAKGLEKYRFMEKLGFFGIDPQSNAGAAAFLRVGRAVLESGSFPGAEAGAVLWVTAEGRFTDPRARPVRLRPGVAHLMRTADRVAVVPLAIEYPFGQEKQLEMRLAFGEPIVVDAAKQEAQTVAAWNTLLEERLTTTMDRLASASMALRPGEAGGFTTLLEGRRGIGGVYDAWRKGRAMLAGRAFDSAHGDAHNPSKRGADA